MSNLEQLKAKKRKELLEKLELKKKELQKHFDEGANNAIDLGKGTIIIGTAALMIYTIFDRYLESRFKSLKPKETERSKSKASTNKLLYPIFSIILQQGASTLFSSGQKRLIEYLQSKKQKNERLRKSISSK